MKIIAKSQTTNIFENNPQADIEIFLKGYRWKELLEYFNINLNILSNNFINYWSKEHIYDIYNLLTFISREPEKNIPNFGYDINIRFTTIDINKTREYFGWLADNNAILQIIN